MRPELDLLLESSRSEAKRWNAAAPNLVHLALAVGRRWPEQFGALFGEQAAGHLRDAARRSAVVGDEVAVVALLEEADGPEPVARLVGELRRAIPDDLLEPAQPDPAAPDPSAPAVPAEEAAEDQGWSPATRTARFLTLVEPDAAIRGREQTVDELIALVGRRSPATPILVGPPGSGRTAVLHALAARLNHPGYDGPLRGLPVVRLSPDAVVAGDRANALRRVLEDLEDPVILAIDDLEVVAALGGQFGDLDLLGVIRSAVEDDGHLVMAVIEDAYLSRLDVLDHGLTNALVPVAIPALSRPVLAELATEAATKLAEHHRVLISPGIVELALAPSGSGDRRAHPGLLHERLDGACTRAALRADRTVVEADLGLDRSPELQVPDAELLADRLGTRVLGQRAALEGVARRLALTRAQLDLRPGRPDGVFLFVGPTGVGKTELARAICIELFGDEERMIRLDMSEYAHDWAMSRLIGPQPGFVGSTEPESWLTTRIARQRETVLLLDEVEKAHPTIWDAFLQVFDAGRLSDSRGTVADFSSTVVVMTSNLGARAFAAPSVGFAPQGDQAADTRERILDTIRQTMRPELVNRIDEVVVFSPLGPAAIGQIAEKEVAAALDRLTARGIVAEVSPEVVDLLVRTGYDEAYGARHLQRNIERLLLQPLAGVPHRRLRARVVGDAIEWEAVAGTAAPTG